MKALLEKVSKLEKRLKDLTEVHYMFVLCESMEDKERLIERYGSDPKTICVTYNLY